MTTTYTLTVGPTDQDLVNSLADHFETEAYNARQRADRYAKHVGEKTRGYTKLMVAEAQGRTSELDAVVRFLRALEIRRRA